MIEILNGTHETVNFSQGLSFQLYYNTDFEAYPNHWHSEMEIIMPTRNIYTVVIDNQTYSLREGDILIIDSGVLHQILKQEGERIIFQPAISVLQNVSGLEDTLSQLSPAVLLTPETDMEIHQKIHDLIMEIKDEYALKEPLTEASIYYRLIEMFVLLGKQQKNQDSLEELSNKTKEHKDTLTYICKYIEEHHAENLTLEKVSEESGFSKYYFERLFKRYTGITFHKYLNQCRVAHAEKLLKDSHKSITDISTYSGFNNLSTFIRIFKYFKGCTPTAFRSANRT